MFIVHVQYSVHVFVLVSCMNFMAAVLSVADRNWTREDTSTWQGCYWRPMGSCRSHRCGEEEFWLSRPVGFDLLRLHALSRHLSWWNGKNVCCCRPHWSVYAIRLPDSCLFSIFCQWIFSLLIKNCYKPCC